MNPTRSLKSYFSFKPTLRKINYVIELQIALKPSKAQMWAWLSANNAWLVASGSCKTNTKRRERHGDEVKHDLKLKWDICKDSKRTVTNKLVFEWFNNSDNMMLSFEWSTHLEPKEPFKSHSGDSLAFPCNALHCCFVLLCSTEFERECQTIAVECKMLREHV